MSWELPDRISVREVGPRDGLQNEDPVPTEAKVALLDALSATGVQRIEAVSFVRPSAIPQMADADEVGSGRPGRPRSGTRRWCRTCGARCAPWTPASPSSRRSSRPRRRTTARTSTVPRPSLDEIAEIIAVAHDRGATVQVIVSTAWGCPYEGDVPAAAWCRWPGGPRRRRGLRLVRRHHRHGHPARVQALVGASVRPTRNRAEPALPQHAGHRPGQRPGRAGARRVRLRRLGRRPGRLPVRARRDRQHRHRGTRAHGRGHGRRHRHRPGRDDGDRRRGRGHRRPRPALPGAGAGPRTRTIAL